MVCNIWIFKVLVSYSSEQLIDQHLVNECWEKMKSEQSWTERSVICDVVNKVVSKNLKMKTTDLLSFKSSGKIYQSEMPLFEACSQLVCSYAKLKLDCRPSLGFLLAVR